MIFNPVLKSQTSFDEFYPEDEFSLTINDIINRDPRTIFDISYGFDYEILSHGAISQQGMDKINLYKDVFDSSHYSLFLEEFAMVFESYYDNLGLESEGAGAFKAFDNLFSLSFSFDFFHWGIRNNAAELPVIVR